MPTDRWAGALVLAALAVLLYLLFLVVQPFLTSLGWAAVLSIVFYPMHERFERRWGAGRSAAATTLAVTLLVIGPILLVMTVFAREAIGAAAELQGAIADGRFTWIERAWRTLEQRVPAAQRVHLATLVTDSFSSTVKFLASQSGFILRNIAGFTFDLVVALLATFFFLRDAPSIMTTVRRAVPLDEPVRERLIAEIRQLVSASVTASALIAAIQGMLGGIIFAAVGIDAPVFWGVIMAFVCLMPLGAWVIYIPAAILLAASGSIGRAVIVAVFGFGIVSSVDNVVRPMLVGGGTTMNGLVILIALLGGVHVFGALGLVLGPVLVVIAVAVLNAYTATKQGQPAAGSQV